jgi:hypothetical protein
MSGSDSGYDYCRYKRLLTEATDAKKRLALIDILIEERARDQLMDQRVSDRAAMIGATIATGHSDV